jgi:hypothetical protein
MTNAEKVLEQAREHQRRVGFGDQAARSAVLDAERGLAAERGEAYAERLELGVRWDAGAPLPHIVSGSSRTVLWCHASEPDPNWDGTYATAVSPSDTAEATFVELTFTRCASIRFGSPSDEALSGHLLWGRGLEFYQAHIVRNSTWLDELIAINSAHDRHNEATWSRLNHYFVGFHDEMFEALATGVDARLVRGTLRGLLVAAAEQFTAS